MHELRRLFIILAAPHTRLLPYKTFCWAESTHSLFGFVIEWQHANHGARSGCNANRQRKDETVSVTHEWGREGGRKSKDWGGIKQITLHLRLDHFPSPSLCVTNTPENVHRLTDEERGGRTEETEGERACDVMKKRLTFTLQLWAEWWPAWKRYRRKKKWKEAHQTSSAATGTFGGLLRQIQCGERENVQWLVATDVGDRKMNLTRGSGVRHRLE